MPSTDEKKLVILDNIENFIEKLLSIISCQDNIISPMEKALIRYKKPNEAWIKKFVHGYTRKRELEITNSIESMKKNTQTDNRLSEFKLVITKSVEGSYNHYLFDELINIVPGYEPVDYHIKDKIVERIQEKIVPRIDDFIYSYKNAKKVQKLKDEELKGNSKNALKGIIAPPVKQDCIKPEDYFLFRNNLLINPKNQQNNSYALDSELKENGTVSTFVLRGNKGQYTLVWLDTLGKAINIDVTTYPKLKEFLAEQKDSSHINHQTLKTYLFKVDIKNPIGQEEFKKKLMAALTKGLQPPKKTKSLESDSDMDEKEDFKPIVSTKPLDYTKFNAVLGIFNDKRYKDPRIEADLPPPILN